MLSTLRLTPSLSVSIDAEEAHAMRVRLIDGSPPGDGLDACWLWSQSTRNGYGQMSVHDTNVYTHQISHQLFIGPIHDEYNVCHSCDVRRCNNPKHFFLGKQLDNVRDMWAKGRASAPPVRRGMAHPKATLTDDQVAEIRRRAATGEKQREIARDFGCSQSTVWRLAHERVRV